MVGKCWCRDVYDFWFRSKIMKTDRPAGAANLSKSDHLHVKLSELWPLCLSCVSGGVFVKLVNTGLKGTEKIRGQEGTDSSSYCSLGFGECIFVLSSCSGEHGPLYRIGPGYFYLRGSLHRMYLSHCWWHLFSYLVLIHCWFSDFCVVFCLFCFLS